jgi:hypothetical protein
MDEKERLAQLVAGDNFGFTAPNRLNNDDDNVHRQLTENERETFDAGWEAAREYYVHSKP